MEQGGAHSSSPLISSSSHPLIPLPCSPAAQVAELEPGCDVLVLATSAQPHACVKKDERSLRAFMQRYIELPLPDHGSRLTLLQAFAQREGLELAPALSLLTPVTAGLSAGQLQEFVRQLAARMVQQGAAAAAPSSGGAADGGAGEAGQAAPAERLPPLMEAALALLPLPAFRPLDEEAAAALREWTIKAHSPLPPEEAPKEGASKKKKG